MSDRDATPANEGLPPLTWEQRDRLLVATGKMLTAEINRRASPVTMRPMYDLLCMLAKYQPAGKPPKSAGVPLGRPSKPLSLLFPSKAQKLAMARSRRPEGAGKRGPVGGQREIQPADAKRVRAMVEYMAKHDRVREYAAADAVLRNISPLSEQEIGDGSRDHFEPTAKRLVRAYQRFDYAAHMPRYRMHCQIHEALQRGDIARARVLFARLQPGRDRSSV